MNILLIGKLQKNLLEAVIDSKFLDKLFTAGSKPLDGIPHIEFEDFNELAQKAKALKIDFAITIDKELIKSGIADVLRKNLVNIIAVNQKWFNLEASRLITKQLAGYYSINIPETIKAPLAFPVIIKTDKPKGRFIANSMQELLDKMQALEGEKTFLEEPLEGEIYKLLSIWDGKNLFNFPIENLTEVQQERLELYKTKLNFMMSDERANFTGFFTSILIWAKNDWYLLEYKMRIDRNISIQCEKDFLFVLNSALYQKLNEI